MNKKLQAVVDEVSREFQERYPGVSLEVYPRQRKSAYVYVTPPENSIWDGEGVWDLLEEMTPQQVDRLVDTGYHIILLPRFRKAPVVDVARLRERAAQWKVEAKSEE
ncbi:MAG: hypothetical protein QG637_1482 [Chloroflexota bacterium]|nr:hypothetical protein [Chloroflexota bacterium]